MDNGRHGYLTAAAGAPDQRGDGMPQSTKRVGQRELVQSGATDRRGPISKHGLCYLRCGLFEAALNACKHPLHAERYQHTKRRLGRQRGPKVAQYWTMFLPPGYWARAQPGEGGWGVRRQKLTSTPKTPNRRRSRDLEFCALAWLSVDEAAGKKAGVGA
jgi:hypothetical protein